MTVGLTVPLRESLLSRLHSHHAVPQTKTGRTIDFKREELTELDGMP